MKMFPLHNKRITVHPGFYLMAACAFMLIPFRWFFAWGFAAFIHEVFHILALKCFGSSRIGINIRWNGAEIIAEPMSGFKMAACALAGPIGSLALVFLFPVMPRVALCGLFQAIVNLLPIYPSDGGRILYGLLCNFAPESTANRICRHIRNGILMLIVGVSVLFCVTTGKMILPVFLTLMILAKTKKLLAIKVGNEYNVFN